MTHHRTPDCPSSRHREQVETRSRGLGCPRRSEHTTSTKAHRCAPCDDVQVLPCAISLRICWSLLWHVEGLSCSRQASSLQRRPVIARCVAYLRHACVPALASAPYPASSVDPLPCGEHGIWGHTKAASTQRTCVGLHVYMSVEAVTPTGQHQELQARGLLGPGPPPAAPHAEC